MTTSRTATEGLARKARLTRDRLDRTELQLKALRVDRRAHVAALLQAGASLAQTAEATGLTRTHVARLRDSLNGANQ